MILMAFGFRFNFVIKNRLTKVNKLEEGNIFCLLKIARHFMIH
jgi:hypothetical protein